MKKLRITALALCLSIALCAVSPCALAEDEGSPKLSSAQSALIGDLASGRILYNVDAYSRRSPASLTKIMTLLLAVEAITTGVKNPNERASSVGMLTSFNAIGLFIGPTLGGFAVELEEPL